MTFLPDFTRVEYNEDTGKYERLMYGLILETGEYGWQVIDADWHTPEWLKDQGEHYDYLQS